MEDVSLLTLALICVYAMFCLLLLFANVFRRAKTARFTPFISVIPDFSAFGYVFITFAVTKLDANYLFLSDVLKYPGLR